MKKTHLYFAVMIAMMAFTSVALACGGEKSGSHNKSAYSGSHHKGKCGTCPLKKSMGSKGSESDARSLKRASSILRDEHPLLAARLERIGADLMGSDNGSIH